MSRFDPYLTLQKLEVFCTVAELCSVSRAAERLCVTQPVISAHLRSLETKIGCALVQRAGRNITLTDAGKRIYRWASEVIIRTWEMERELAGIAKGSHGSAIISTSMTVGSYILAPILSDFAQKNTDGLITAYTENPAAALDAARIGKCDFAITILEPDLNVDRLTVHHLWDEPLVLVCAPETRWLDPKNPMRRLPHAPFVSAPKTLIRRAAEDRVLSRIGLDSRRVLLEFGHPEAMKSVIKQDAAIGFLLRSSIEQEIQNGTLQIVELPGHAFHLPNYLVHQTNKTFSPFQASILEHIITSTQQRRPETGEASLSGSPQKTENKAR